jgi:alpha-tubulin suppressor-like RCC1 family protein
MNRNGQLGDGSTSNRSTPVVVSGVIGAVEIASGFEHSCVRYPDGTAQCWGQGWLGELGDDNTADQLTPVTVQGLSGATQIALGAGHSCVIVHNGTVMCLGSNSYGQLGDGTTTPSGTIVAVQGLSDAAQITAGWLHACACLADGRAECWGNNGYYQLGYGSTLDQYQPTPELVTGLSGTVEIAAGHQHSCALANDGTVRCWGRNDSGQLGNGTTLSSATPVTVIE